MTTFRTSQCQDSADEVLEFDELRCEDIKRSFRKPNPHTTEHIMKDSKRYFVEILGKF